MAEVQAKSLTGKVALVTGGSRGIGAGVVRRLAMEGASVAFTYSSSEERALQLVHEIESEGGGRRGSRLTVRRLPISRALYDKLPKRSALSIFS